MDELIKGLMEKVGLDEEKAKGVIEFIKEHMDDLPKLLSGDAIGDLMKGDIGGALGGLFGGGDDDDKAEG